MPNLVPNINLLLKIKILIEISKIKLSRELEIDFFTKSFKIIL